MSLERVNFEELAGIAARRKADRLAAQHRGEGWDAARRIHAERVRDMKTDRSGDLVCRLEEIRDARKLVAGRDYGRWWPLVRENFAEASVSIPLSGNTVPAKADVEIRLSDKGRRYLARIMRTLSETDDERVAT